MAGIRIQVPDDKTDNYKFKARGAQTDPSVTCSYFVECNWKHAHVPWSVLVDNRRKAVDYCSGPDCRDDKIVVYIG